MSTERWRRIEELYHAARDRELVDRAAFLVSACGSDDDLRRQVQSLLDENTAREGVLDITADKSSATTRTTLGPGAQLGPYRIEGPLGKGGMGEVFRAVDTRLGRQVAIKVCMGAFSGRFTREARTIASLNHPHICTVHDVGPNYLVMELVEGETLSGRLRKRALPLEMALNYGAEIADALAAAHARGIVHRDLKPANIVVGKSGVKVLDFGLAKSSQDLTLTAANQVIGTPAYMSPEQREGRECDARTDIYALGLVLYEMVTGRRVPDSGTPPSYLPTQPALNWAVSTCLATDPEQRWQSAADLARCLRWISSSPARTVVPPEGKNQRRLVPLIALAVVLAGMVAVALPWWRTQTAAMLVRALILPPAGSRFEFTGDVGGPPVLSPDGSRLVFAARGDDRDGLWIRRLDSEIPQRLIGTEHAAFPFWSPDSRFVAYFSDGYLKKVPAGGGPVSNIAVAENARGGAWGGGDTIVFAPRYRDGLYTVSANGGPPRRITDPEKAGHTSHRWPSFLPGGAHFLYLAANHENIGGEHNGIYLGSLDGSVNRLVVRSGAQAQYAAGNLLYYANGALLAQPFNTSTGQFERDAVTIARGIQVDATVWHANFSVAEAGALVYQSGGNIEGRDLVWRDRHGNRTGALGRRDTYGDFAISPDGHRVVASVGSQEQDLWIFDIASGRGQRLTFGGGSHIAPVWSPDGRKIAFGWLKARLGEGRADSGLYIMNAGGVDEPSTMADHPLRTSALPLDWSPDGKYILYLDRSRPAAAGLSAVGVTGDATPIVISANCAGQASFSPDGRWIAYDASGTGKFQVFVTSFPTLKGRRQLSTDGGLSPLWAGTASELWFLDAENMLTVASLDTKGEEVRVVHQQPLFRAAAVGGFTQPFRVPRNGQQILLNTLPDDPSTPLTLIADWRQLLTRK